jgi:hypothetical protein
LQLRCANRAEQLGQNADAISGCSSNGPASSCDSACFAGKLTAVGCAIIRVSFGRMFIAYPAKREKETSPQAVRDAPSEQTSILTPKEAGLFPYIR